MERLAIRMYEYDTAPKTSVSVPPAVPPESLVYPDPFVSVQKRCPQAAAHLRRAAGVMSGTAHFDQAALEEVIDSILHGEEAARRCGVALPEADLMRVRAEILSRVDSLVRRGSVQSRSRQPVDRVSGTRVGSTGADVEEKKR